MSARDDAIALGYKHGLIVATRDVCMYCAHRSTMGWHAAQATDAGEWEHRATEWWRGPGSTVPCPAGAIHARLAVLEREGERT